MSEIDPDHEERKKALQALGIGLMLGGGLFALIGGIDFFSAFGSDASPKLYWMLFIGLPVAGLGARLAGFGYMREITRYGAGEVVPVAKSALDYLKDPDTSEAELIRCPYCSVANEPDAKFCDSCGKPLGQICSSCGTHNDADSRFCDNCGKALTGPASELS